MWEVDFMISIQKKKKHEQFLYSSTERTLSIDYHSYSVYKNVRYVS